MEDCDMDLVSQDEDEEISSDEDEEISSNEDEEMSGDEESSDDTGISSEEESTDEEFKDPRDMEPEDRWEYNKTPLIRACEWGRVEEAKLLIEEDSDELERTDQAGDTAFIWACRGNQVEIVKVLIEAGAELEPKYCFNFFRPGFIHAFNWFCRDNSVELVKLLIEAGVTIDLPKLPRVDEKRKRYQYVKELCQIEINKNEKLKETMKEIWIDVSLLIIDTIGEFIYDVEILEDNVKRIDIALSFE
jgi:ankyrin repeat protein